MLPFLLIVLSKGVNLFEGIFIKRHNQKHGKGGFLFTATVSLFSMLFFILKDLLLADGSIILDKSIFLYALLAGVFYASASFLTFVALGCGSFTLSNLILSYGGVFSIAYGLFVLKESLSVTAYIGLGLVLVSIFLSVGEKKTDEKEKKLSLLWLVTIGISFVGSGMFGVLMRVQQVKFNAALDNEFMILTLGISAILLFIIGFIKDGRELVPFVRHGAGYAALAGLSNGATNALALVVTTMIPVSLSSPISSGVKIVLSFLVSLLLFREKFTKKQLAGVVLGTAALILLNV